jgi:hypothetical protein
MVFSFDEGAPGFSAVIPANAGIHLDLAFES